MFNIQIIEDFLVQGFINAKNCNIEDDICIIRLNKAIERSRSMLEMYLHDVESAYYYLKHGSDFEESDKFNN